MKKLELAPGTPILVRSPNWVGDAVMALPFYDALRQLFPGSPIAVAARPHAAGIARLDAAVEVLEQDDRAAGALGKLSLARELARRHFGAAFLLPNSFSSALLPFLARVPIRAGYSKDARGLLLTHRVAWDARARSLHRSEAYLGLLAALGLEPGRKPRTAYRVTRQERGRAAELLSALGVASGERLIAVAPGAVGVSRRWPVERFAQVAVLLSRRLGARCLALGGSGDRPLTAAVARASEGLALDLAGRSPLSLLPALIERTLVLISNDSGAAHVATLTSTPTVVLFGAGNEAITRPLGPNVHVLRHTLDCTPCEKNTCARGDLACLAAIEVEAVVREAERLAGRQGP